MAGVVVSITTPWSKDFASSITPREFSQRAAQHSDVLMGKCSKETVAA
jgi:hypothetical protein